MTLPRFARNLLLALSGIAVGLLSAQVALSQKSEKATTPAAAGLLDENQKVLPRPKRPELPPSKLPLEFIKGERIALVGNSTAERMNLYGHFETLLHLRHPDKQLVVRNFGFPADEVGVRQRSADYQFQTKNGNVDTPLFAFNPDTFLCFFGFNESFAGAAGVEKFKADYETFLDDFAKKYPRDDAGSPPRFVLISPIAFEFTGDPLLPSGETENANLKLYAEAVKAVADKRKLAFVDLFALTYKNFSTDKGRHSTVNGAHLNKNGDLVVGMLLDFVLFGGENPGAKDTAKFEKVRAAVNDKSWVHHQDYRMVNGWYVYGGRRTWDHETFPKEYVKIRNMAAVREQYVWDLVNDKQVAEKPDDSKTGDLFVPQTRFGEPRQKYSENQEGGPRILPPDELIKTITTPPGLEVKLFADESMVPELQKPVQLNFDNKGRLWVACMPNYPQWKPGDVRANDRLLILEDTDGDGKADKKKVFYDKLHCPTGFEFFNGGVLVMDQPRIVFLKDTNGDDVADVVEYLMDGWATDDTHHRGGWEWGNGGLLHILEGIATSTTLETPWGPHRSQGAGGCYVLDPRTWKVRQFSLPGMYNMWCYAFDEWGQGIVGDGTTANQTWDTPLSGAQYPGRKGLNFILPNGERPNLGNEWLVSRNLPDELQNQFIYACVINLNGMPRYTMKDDGAGFMGERVKGTNGEKWSDLIKSTDKHFRPANPTIGPDGALWFGDWANPLIGHMQYSQRDPNRDHIRGRIYRLVGKDRPLVKPVTQDGKSVAEILGQLGEYEWRTRYRARNELRGRPAAEVLPVVADWAKMLDANDPNRDRFLCEALWAQQGHHAVDPELLKAVLASKDFHARAAATRVLADERDRVPGAFDLFVKMSTDDHPRVRTEAIRALSFYPTQEAVNALLAATAKPLDYWTRYTLEASLGANQKIWAEAHRTGKLAQAGAEAKGIMDAIVFSSKADAAALPHIRLLLSQEPKTVEVKNKAMTALATLKGNTNKGREVFVRSCTACHKVGNGEGQDYGPNLAGTMTRLKTRTKIIESIVDPNAEVDKKYLSTRVDTIDGKTITGLVIAEDKKQVTIFDGKEKKVIAVDDIDKRSVLKQSSMPEGQAGAMAPAEFVDLVEYLAAQNQPEPAKK